MRPTRRLRIILQKKLIRNISQKIFLIKYNSSDVKMYNCKVKVKLKAKSVVDIFLVSYVIPTQRICSRSKPVNQDTSDQWKHS